VTIVDAHHHFWDLALDRHPWLTHAPRSDFRYGDYSRLRQSYLPEDYVRDTAAQNVVASVYVETEWDVDDEVGETRWLADVRAGYGRPIVAVAHARFERDDVDAVLSAHAAFDFVRGIRQKPAAAATPEAVSKGAPGSMGDPRWQRGYALLERYGMSFDLQTPWWHLPEAADLAREFPRTTIIVNHTGLPADRTTEGLEAWRDALETVAALPNVALKIGGLGQVDGGWSYASNRRVIRDAITIFGVERCMFASNFPVDSLCADYDTIVDGFRRSVDDFTPADQARLFHENARRIYRIAA
jgi:predicted TIM-barrel fold metal-dependent hydrolase